MCRPWRLRSVELSIALFDATSPLVPGYSHANMVRASSFACTGDFLLRLAVCQGENLIAERRRGALAASGFCGRAPACSLRRGWVAGVTGVDVLAEADFLTRAPVL